MKHIKEQYGAPTNLLELTQDEMEALEPFLRAVGVRIRATMAYGVYRTIQAENPYRAYCPPRQREMADAHMTPDAIAHYKR